MAAALEKVCLIGSGNWGSAIAKIVGQNVLRHKTTFAPEVRMWVFEEKVDGKNLTQIINEKHENVKYLPGIALPHSIIADPELVSTITDATLLVFVVPHQFVNSLCAQIMKSGKLHPRARAISLIKGVDTGSGGLSLISDVMRKTLNIDVSVLMGANIANEVAQEKFCETTIGYSNADNGKLWKSVFDARWFKVRTVNDVAGTEICGALKNVVAVAAGIIDGLKLGDNSKAAIIRIGLQEMRAFAKMQFQGVKDETFFESCGIADLITTCSGGRNRKVAEARVLTGKTFEELEKELLNGQKLQGTLTSQEIHEVLKAKGLTAQYPLFTAVYRICYENLEPAELVNQLNDI